MAGFYRSVCLAVDGAFGLRLENVGMPHHWTASQGGYCLYTGYSLRRRHQCSGLHALDCIQFYALCAALFPVRGDNCHLAARSRQTMGMVHGLPQPVLGVVHRFLGLSNRKSFPLTRFKNLGGTNSVACLRLDDIDMRTDADASYD